jgi:hypothetical protein
VSQKARAGPLLAGLFTSSGRNSTNFVCSAHARESVEALESRNEGCPSWGFPSTALGSWRVSRALQLPPPPKFRFAKFCPERAGILGESKAIFHGASFGLRVRGSCVSSFWVGWLASLGASLFGDAIYAENS